MNSKSQLQLTFKRLLRLAVMEGGESVLAIHPSVKRREKMMFAAMARVLADLG
jgi:hypothetical protein